MSIIRLQTSVGDVALKKDGKVQIKLEASVTDLTAAELHTLSRMLGTKVETELDTNTIEYRVEIDVKNNKPLTTYKVNKDGTVDQVATVDPQMTIEDAGVEVPKGEPEVREEIKAVDKEIVDAFIRENLAPKFDDMKIDMYDILTRRDAGDSFREIAKDYDMSPNEFQAAMNEYRQRVAPMAEAWNVWKAKNAIEEKLSDDAQISPTSDAEENTSEVSTEGDNGETGQEQTPENAENEDVKPEDDEEEKF